MRKIVMNLLCAVLMLTVVTDCSVVQATSGPEQKNFAVLDKGTQRYLVLAEFGQPVVTDVDQEGRKYDIFKFKQGQNGAVKASKAVLYGAAAVCTLGLSEVITSPLEGAAGKGAEIKARVLYDDKDQVGMVDVLEDGRWLPMQKLGDQPQG